MAAYEVRMWLDWEGSASELHEALIGLLETGALGPRLLQHAGASIALEEAEV